jgi:starvation-inducible outer membrane lipoprotein
VRLPRKPLWRCALALVALALAAGAPPPTATQVRARPDEDLWRAFREDAADARARYSGQLVRVHGKVTNIQNAGLMTAVTVQNRGRFECLFFPLDPEVQKAL